ncbi:A/G-specific adenine glycosylase [Mucilaginibacter myungsuensis]|uniref:Adenine DNA glycosylase n=1 Tax=Mucilaginibacter myungsuensis TaxID=649104 RepID=A0A929KZI9_9SPHI|nr:A/G-specific adenine glycosylase [Mucilaginibacter myungsuensis]MBE9664077.1 A/G-specific adenine glycosylase [Mucilaginibacter myungsuensis]MDN3601256.1 A/G-specific adenine glycosylase [Mucilaginibacter myungsuensis]
MDLSAQLIKWYQANKRDLPWRHTTDPYVIWLSEIILQQTRVEQGLPYFNRFLEKYPTVSHFAAATEDEVLNLWQGLGYYSRGRNMLYTARLVQELYRGQFPSSYDQLISLKGIGEYTAAAISSFSANEAKAVVDGNVYRVLARYYGIDEPINSTGGKKTFQSLADGLLDKNRPALHNQAMMEFGAMLCKPKNPACGICPVHLDCYAFKNNATIALPVKLKTVKIRKRYFNYLLIMRGDEILMHKRGAGDIWTNMYQLPLIETAGPTELHNLMELPQMQQFMADNVSLSPVSQVYKHVLTHQHLYVSFTKVDGKTGGYGEGYFFTEVKNLKNLALPQIIFLFLTKFLN